MPRETRDHTHYDALIHLFAQTLQPRIATMKSYLRYSIAGTFGVIASPASNAELDPTGTLLFTAQLEHVGVWNIKRGTEVRRCRAAAQPLQHFWR